MPVIILNHSTANEDFSVGLNNTLVFNKSVKHNSFSVAITNDSSYESNEHFSVDLQVDAQGYNITLDPNSANITIIDDEGQFVFVCLFVCFLIRLLSQVPSVATCRRTIFHSTKFFMHQHNHL